MKITFEKLVPLGAVVFITVAIAATGCKSDSTRTMGQKYGDREVEKGVRKALDNDPTFKFTDVKPEAYEGSVQLTGLVETPEQRFRAAELAAQVKGAKQIINQIMIKGTPTGPVTIRDPLGQETGHLLIDTNAYVPHMRELPPSSAPQKQPAPGTDSTGGYNQKP